MTHHFSEPTNFKLIGRSDKTLTVSWLDPEHKINNRGNDKYYYSITIQSENATFDNELRVESEENKKVIEGLEPSKKYKITIETKSNIKIDSLCPTNYIKINYNDLMATITATTRPLTPEMPNFTDVTETSAVISWNSHNSIIKDDSVWYTVEYNWIDPNTTKDMTPPVNDVRRTKRTSKKLENLKAGNTYKVHIKVNTDLLGESDASPGVIFKTISLTNDSQKNLREKLGIIKTEGDMESKKSTTFKYPIFNYSI